MNNKAKYKSTAFELAAGVLIFVVAIWFWSSRQDRTLAKPKIELIREQLPLLTDAVSAKTVSLNETNVLLVDAVGCITYQLAVLRHLRGMQEDSAEYLPPIVVVHSTSKLNSQMRQRALMLMKISRLETRYLFTPEFIVRPESQASVVSSFFNDGFLTDPYKVVPIESKIN